MSLRDSAIVAYAETKVMDKSDRDIWVLSGEILETLLDKTGFEKAEIDGLVMAGLTATGAGNMFWAQTTADQLGLEIDFCEQVHTGGCSAAGSVARAAAAIDAGMCTTAFLLFADTGVLENNRGQERTYRREWTDPYGLMGPPGSFGLLSRAYEAQYGLDYRMLGKLAVTQRNHALMNENACEKLRVPITIDDYLNSRMIADPIRLLDCVMPADGAAGLIVTSRKRAKEKGLNNCIIPIGYAERTNFLGGESLVDVTRSGHEVAGRRALAQAGMSIKDVKSFHPYDDFIIAIMMQFEAFGFCKPGQGIPFIREHDFAYNGDLPLNTGGGQISAGQAACSSHNLVEAVRQLMGEAGQRQVRNTENALVTGIGWINYGRNWGTSAALMLVPND
jgi:acetyl-CoA acetyltransferase